MLAKPKIEWYLLLSVLGGVKVSTGKQKSMRHVPVATTRVIPKWHFLIGNDNVVHVNFGARKSAVAVARAA